MKTNRVHIHQITKEIGVEKNNDLFTVCWIKDGVDSLEINREIYRDISNSMVFLNPEKEWKIYKSDDVSCSGYILYLAKEVFDNPLLSNLHINKVRYFSNGQIPLFKLSPGIEKRTQAILEMIDELLGSQLNYKDDAILSLLNTFFVYCDGQCNIKSVASNNNAKANLVYKFKRLVDDRILKSLEVSYYADILNISPKYLNECVQEVLGVSAKHIIIEQLLIKSRHQLKFSDNTIKEISFQLGFSSPDYFSYFFKNHTGTTPSALRKA